MNVYYLRFYFEASDKLCQWKIAHNQALKENANYVFVISLSYMISLLVFKFGISMISCETEDA